MGFAWTIFIILRGSSVQFENANISYQAPLLIATVLFKYLVLLA